MSPLVRLVAALIGAALPALAHAQDRLLVCNKAEHTLWIYDPTTRERLATVPTGQGPHEVAVSPDGRTAVVSDYGAQKPGSTLTVVDVLAAKVLRTIPLARIDVPAGEGGPKHYLRPHGSAFVGEHELVITSEATKRLLLVDLTKDAVARVWTTPQVSMHMVAVTSDGRRAAATSIRDGDVTLFDLGGDAAPRVVACGAGSEGIAVNPKTGDVWVGNREADTLTVVDGTTGEAGEPIDAGDFPFRVAFVPDGSRALVTCAEGGELQVYDAKTKELLHSLEIHGDASELGAQPLGLCVDPDGTFCYVACGRGEFVAVVDLTKNEVVGRMQAGAGPDGIAYARVALGAIR